MKFAVDYYEKNFKKMFKPSEGFGSDFKFDYGTEIEFYAVYFQHLRRICLKFAFSYSKYSNI
jgi:hypothetical protein